VKSWSENYWFIGIFAIFADGKTSNIIAMPDISPELINLVFFN
jgi:hypothetical protein